MRKLGLRPALLAAGILIAAAPAHAQPAATADTQFDFANGLYSREHYASAAEAYVAFLDVAPDDPRAQTAMFRLGECYYAAEQYPEAQQAYATLLHRWPAGDRADAARLRKGQCALARGRHAEAIAEMQRLLQGTPAPEVRAAALYALGQSAYDSGDAVEATRAFRLLATVNGAPALTLYADYYLGYLRWQADDVAGAYARFAAFAARADDPALLGEALVRAGETALALERPEDAATHFAAALAVPVPDELLDTAAVGLAWAAYKRARYAEATAVYAAWGARLSARAPRAELRYVAGEAAFQAGDYARAAADLGAVVRDPAADHVRAAARLRLAWTQFLQDDFTACAATADAGMAAGDRVSREELAYLAAAARFGLKDYARAAEGLRAFAEVFAASPLRADAYYHLGASEQALGRLTAARDAYEAAIAAGDPAARGARAIFKAGDARFGLEDFDGAATHWRTITTDYAADPFAGDALFRLGLAHFRLEAFPAMENAFAQFRARYAEHDLAVQAAYWLGWAQQRQEKYVDATVSYAIVTRDRRVEHYADALGRQALCAYQAEEETQAAVLYVRYLREIPDRPLPRDVLFWLGYFMRERGDWQTAQFVYERAMVQHPTDDVIEAARYEVGRCYRTGGKQAEALAAFERVLADFPDGAYATRAQLGRGQVLQSQKRYLPAIEALTVVAQQDEGGLAAEANLRLGQCFEAQGRTREAADRYLFVTIVFDAPDLAGDAYVSAGRCLEQLHELEQARATYAEFIDRYPDDPQAQAARERLQALAPPPPPAAPAVPAAAAESAAS